MGVKVVGAIYEKDGVLMLSREASLLTEFEQTTNRREVFLILQRRSRSKKSKQADQKRKSGKKTARTEKKKWKEQYNRPSNQEVKALVGGGGLGLWWGVLGFVVGWGCGVGGFGFCFGGCWGYGLGGGKLIQ